MFRVITKTAAPRGRRVSSCPIVQRLLPLEQGTATEERLIHEIPDAQGSSLPNGHLPGNRDATQTLPTRNTCRLRPAFVRRVERGHNYAAVRAKDRPVINTVGARWIYFWSSDRDHHLPFEEQLALARGLSEHVASHPRPARRDLVRGAEDAIVLPYGFTFSVSDWQKARLPGLWQRGAYPIEMRTMDDGTPYYSVLRCAAEEMERLIDEDREFDIVIDLPRVKSAGYARLYDVLPRARQARYEFLWSIRARYYYILAGLITFLVVFHTYRIVRWVRRRRKAKGLAPPGLATEIPDCRISCTCSASTGCPFRSRRGWSGRCRGAVDRGSTPGERYLGQETLYCQRRGIGLDTRTCRRRRVHRDFAHGP